MKKLPLLSQRKADIKDRPDYYITPTRDFTQYTRDCEEKYWRKETAFDWQQNIAHNLRDHLEQLSPENLSRVTFMVLPMVKETIDRRIEKIRAAELPIEEDALKDIGDCLPSDKTSIDQALSIVIPLKDRQLYTLKLKDQAEILQKAMMELSDQQRLGLFRRGIAVKQLETEAERNEQAVELSNLANQLDRIQAELNQLSLRNKTEIRELKAKIRRELDSVEQQVLSDLEETLELVKRAIQSKDLPRQDEDLLFCGHFEFADSFGDNLE
jgi:hypothetical protein